MIVVSTSTSYGFTASTNRTLVAHFSQITYTITTNFVGSPAPQSDAPLSLAIRLPVTTPPTQVPTIVSAGIALSPYERSADYSTTNARERALWIELDDTLSEHQVRRAGDLNPPRHNPIRSPNSPQQCCI